MKHYLIAIDAGGTFFKSAIVSSDAEVLENSLVTVPANNDGTPDQVREGYRRTLKLQLSHAEKAGIIPEAVAIDTPGPFDYAAGISLMKHKFKAIYGIELRPWIREVVGDLPVVFLHDSAAFMGGELWHSPFGDFKNAGGAMIGTGLGFATVKDGVVLRRDDGEPLYSLWNVPMPGGKIVEDYVSGRGIASRFRDGHTGAKEIEHLAREGNREALEVYRETGRILAEAAAPYLEKVGAEIFILGGQISRSLPLFEDVMRERLSDVKTLKKIVRSERIETGHMLGAAYECFQKLGLL